MLIVCPGCAIRYDYDERKIGPDGVTIRCGGCRRLFRIVPKAPAMPVQQPPADVTVPSEIITQHEKARRLARAIVSDIAVYNQGKVDEGVRQGTLFSLLAEEIEEGRALYASRVPAEIVQNSSYLDDALAEMVKRRRQKAGLQPL